MQNLNLLVTTLHHLTKHFKDHAVLKGGMELALYSSARSTNDLDFVFVPFKSKKDIVTDVEKCLQKMGDDVKISVSINSKHAKFIVAQANEKIEVEINVAENLASVPMNTAVLARKVKLPPQIIRVMKPEVALAHKIGAWNERRLLRDVYDIYFWFGIQNIFPDMTILEKRLQSIESRIPKFKSRKSMTLEILCQELQEFCTQISQKDIDQELSSLTDQERQHLDKVMLSQINLLVSRLIAIINSKKSSSFLNLPTI